MRTKSVGARFPYEEIVTNHYKKSPLSFDLSLSPHISICFPNICPSFLFSHNPLTESHKQKNLKKKKINTCPNKVNHKNGPKHNEPQLNHLIKSKFIKTDSLSLNKLLCNICTSKCHIKLMTVSKKTFEPK